MTSLSHLNQPLTCKGLLLALTLAAVFSVAGGPTSAHASATQASMSAVQSAVRDARDRAWQRSRTTERNVPAAPQTFRVR
jgi:Ni/Co efflux regulator RcnB